MDRNKDEIFDKVEVTLGRAFQQLTAPELNTLVKEIEKCDVKVDVRNGIYIITGQWEDVERVHSHLHEKICKEKYLNNEKSKIPAAAAAKESLAAGGYEKGKMRNEHFEKEYINQNLYQSLGEERAGRSELAEYGRDSGIRGHKEELQEISDLETDQAIGGCFAKPEILEDESKLHNLKDLILDRDIWQYINFKKVNQFNEVMNFGAKVTVQDSDTNTVRILISSPNEGDSDDVVSLVHDSLIQLSADVLGRVLVETTRYPVSYKTFTSFAQGKVEKSFPTVLIKCLRGRNFIQYNFIGSSADVNAALTEFKYVVMDELKAFGNTRHLNSYEEESYERGDREFERGEIRQDKIQDRSEERQDSIQDNRDGRQDSIQDRREGRKDTIQDRREERQGSIQDRREGRQDAMQDRREGRQISIQDRREGRQDSIQDRREGRQNSIQDRRDERQDSLQDRREGRQDSIQDRRGERQDKIQDLRETNSKYPDVISAAAKPVKTSGNNPKDINLDEKETDEDFQAAKEIKLSIDKNNIGKMTGEDDKQQITQIDSDDHGLSTGSKYSVCKEEEQEEEEEEEEDRQLNNSVADKVNSENLLQGQWSVKLSDVTLILTITEDPKLSLSGYQKYGTFIIKAEQLDEIDEEEVYEELFQAYVPATEEGSEAVLLMKELFLQKKLLRRDDADTLVPRIELKESINGTEGYPDDKYMEKLTHQLSILRKQ